MRDPKSRLMRPNERGDPRIALLLVQYIAENSGSWQVLRTLMGGLDPRRFRIALVLPCKGEVEATISPHIRIYYVRIPQFRRSISPSYLSGFLIGMISSGMALRRIIREESIDILHCNGLPNLFPALAAVSSGVPLVWHVHELEFQPTAVFRVLVWLCGKLADRIVCVSQGVVRLFAGSEKALLIYNGVDINHFQPMRFPVERTDFDASEETKRGLSIRSSVASFPSRGWNGSSHLLRQ